MAKELWRSTNARRERKKRVRLYRGRLRTVFDPSVDLLLRLRIARELKETLVAEEARLIVLAIQRGHSRQEIIDASPAQPLTSSNVDSAVASSALARGGLDGDALPNTDDPSTPQFIGRRDSRPGKPKHRRRF